MIQLHSTSRDPAAALVQYVLSSILLTHVCAEELCIYNRFGEERDAI